MTFRSFGDGTPVMVTCSKVGLPVWAFVERYKPRRGALKSEVFGLPPVPCAVTTKIVLLLSGLTSIRPIDRPVKTSLPRPSNRYGPPRVGDGELAFLIMERPLPPKLSAERLFSPVPM